MSSHTPSSSLPSAPRAPISVAGESRAEILLGAVVSATRSLVVHDDLYLGLREAVAHLGFASLYDRAYVLEFHERDNTISIAAHWCSAGLVDVTKALGNRRISVSHLAEVLRSLNLAGIYTSAFQPQQIKLGEVAEGRSSFKELIVPVYVDGAIWGAIGLDNCRSLETCQPAEIAALRGAAESVAAAVQRCRAREAQKASEQLRAEQASRLRRLLEGVVDASSLLHERDCFDQALESWLEKIARSGGADSAYFGRFTGQGVPVTESGWRCPECRVTKEQVISSAIPLTSDFRDWITRLIRGEVVSASLDELSDPISVHYWMQLDRASCVVAPVRHGEHVLGWLGFDSGRQLRWDDNQLAVLVSAAHSLAAAIVRNDAERTALNAEHQRATQAVATQALLKGVVEAARVLHEHESISDALETWLATISQPARVDQLWIGEFNEDGQPVMKAGWQSPGALITKEQIVNTPIPLSEDFKKWVTLLRAGEVVGTHLGEMSDPASHMYFRAVGVNSAVIAPLRARQRTIGWISFNSWNDSLWDESQVAVLKMAAGVLGAALDREAARQAATDEREERLKAESNRSRELRLANKAISDAVSGLARGSDLECFLNDLLRAAIEAVGARSGLICILDGKHTYELVCRVPTPNGGTARVELNHIPLLISFEPTNPQFNGVTFADFMVVPAESEALSHSQRQHHLGVGNQCVGMLPLFSSDRMIGWIELGFLHDSQPHPSAVDLLRVLTDQMTVALELARLAAEARDAAVLVERERIERARLLELSKVNGSLRASLEALAESADADAFFGRCLLEISEVAEAQTVLLYRASRTGKKMRLMVSSQEGALQFGEGQDFDSKNYSIQTIAIRSTGGADAQLPGRFIWTLIDNSISDTDELYDWHVSQGHAACAKQPLMIGPRQVGLVILAYQHNTPPGTAQHELVHALSQPLALALELMRLGRESKLSAERAAILAERNRLAREIHDGIAQSFLAIQMRLSGLSTQESAVEVRQALDLARHGLTEARRAVSALRPQSLVDRNLPDAVTSALTTWTESVDIRVSVEKPDIWYPLSAEAEDHLFRLVQEAVQNVIKHASASRIHVEISQGLDTTSVLIADDGVGFSLNGAVTGFGLDSMRQRASLLGGQLQLHSKPGAGTQVLISLPTSRGREEEDDH